MSIVNLILLGTHFMIYQEQPLLFYMFVQFWNIAVLFSRLIL